VKNTSDKCLKTKYLDVRNMMLNWQFTLLNAEIHALYKLPKIMNSRGYDGLGI
jgi:hypothetical protein